MTWVFPEGARKDGKASKPSHLRPPLPPIPQSIRDIQLQACIEFMISRSELVGKDRHWRFMVPRKIAMYLCREITEKPYSLIGRAFERDVATVQYACRTLPELLASHHGGHLIPKVEAIRKRVKEKPPVSGEAPEGSSSARGV